MTREEEIKEFKRNMTDGSFCVSDEIVNDIIDETIEWVDEHPKNPWRDVKKDPPTEEGWVFVITDRLDVYYYKDNKWYDERENLRFLPDYWMPIPDAPKGGER